MDSNTIRVHVSLSFKGEAHELDALIDLDLCVTEPGVTPDVHRLLAEQAGIDPYSYLYEVLESEEITYSEPRGLAVLAFEDDGFNWFRYEQVSKEARDWQAVRAIAAQHLGDRDLDGDAELRTTLLAVYRAGQCNYVP